MRAIPFIIILLSIRIASFSQVPVFYSPEAAKWADSVMAKMTPDKRNGQLFMVAAWSNKDSTHVKEIQNLIIEQGIGGLIFFQGGPVRQALLTNNYQRIAPVPLLMGIDGEWGLSMRLDSTVRFPRQMTLTAMHNDSLLNVMGEEIAKECRRMGIHINFAPDADINNNMMNPIIGSRSFGDNRFEVTKSSMIYMNALQRNHVLACGKHFPGHGNTNADSHFLLPVVNTDSAAMDSVELYPFRQLINAGLGSVMVAHLSVPALDTIPSNPSTLSKKIVTGLLKEKMGFNGIVFTDALNMKGVSTCFAPGILDKEALLAGNDVLLYSEDVPTGLAQIHLAVENCEITQEDIDARVRKILMLKYWALQGRIPRVDTTNIYADLNSSHALLLQQKLYEGSLTVLSNKESIVPIRKDSIRIASLVIGDKMNNAFQQRMKMYYPVETFVVDGNASVAAFSAVEKDIAKHQLIILSLHGTTMKGDKNFNISDNEQKFIEELINKYPVVFVDFGNAYTLTRFKNLDRAKAVVLAYEDMPVMHDLAAQVIFGGVQANGVLPVNSGETFTKNKGLQTSSPIRMKYSLPEDAGLDSKVLSRIDTIASNAIAMHATPGCQVLVAKDGKIVYYKSFGQPTYEDTVKVSKEDLYDIASVSKIAGTALAAMKIYDQGKIDLDKPMSKYLPMLRGSDKKGLTLREILAHQAGLKSWIPFWKQTVKGDLIDSNIYHKVTDDKYSIQVADSMFMSNTYKDSLMKWVKESPLGERGKYVYSDLGPILMKSLVERISAQPIDEYLKKNFYQPLGFSRLSYQPRKKYTLKEIIPTENDKQFRKQLIHGYVHDPAAAMFGGISGNAGLFSDANDLAVLMQMLLNKGSYGGHQYIKSSTVELFTRQQYYGNRRGLLFDKAEPDITKASPVCKSASSETFGHQGFTGTCAWADPKYNIIYIFLSNRVHPDATNELLTKMNVRTEIQQVIYDAMKP